MSPSVEAIGLTKTYSRGTERIVAVDNAAFALEAGEIVALVGASGSGKSTLLNLIAGFDRPDQGRIAIGDFDVTGANDATLDAARTSAIGFVFQQFHLVGGLTAIENVELALMRRKGSAAERRKDALAALARVGLAGLEHRRPSQLSGGQQQRVAIARALVGKPKVILADEPTAALDEATATSLLSELVAMAKADGAAVLLSTHDPRCIAHADRVLTLKNGSMSA